MQLCGSAVISTGCDQDSHHIQTVSLQGNESTGAVSYAHKLHVPVTNETLESPHSRSLSALLHNVFSRCLYTQLFSQRTLPSWFNLSQQRMPAVYTFTVWTLIATAIASSTALHGPLKWSVTRATRPSCNSFVALCSQILCQTTVNKQS